MQSRIALGTVRDPGGRDLDPGAALRAEALKGDAPNASSIPAVVTSDADGWVRLELTSPRPDEIDTVITAHCAG
jgi:hypothetical protein